MITKRISLVHTITNYDLQMQIQCFEFLDIFGSNAERSAMLLYVPEIDIFPQLPWRDSKAAELFAFLKQIHGDLG